MFDEITVNQWIDVADDALGIDLDARPQIGLLTAQDERRTRHRQGETSSRSFHRPYLHRSCSHTMRPQTTGTTGQQ
jgi:hypothetical protein